jgi:hypothetical protein
MQSASEIGRILPQMRGTVLKDTIDRFGDAGQEAFSGDRHARCIQDQQHHKTANQSGHHTWRGNKAQI